MQILSLTFQPVFSYLSYSAVPISLDRNFLSSTLPLRLLLSRRYRSLVSQVLRL